MPVPFRRLTAVQFSYLMDRTLLSRHIDAVHVHHTWKPAHDDWRGEATLTAMRNYHLSLGWDDIAQHVTIDPAGGIWTGRNWNVAPASSSGHNGTAAAGPFMFEMVGNFDAGHDPFGGDQRRAAVAVTARVLDAFGLKASAVHFHRELNGNKKTCPGTAVDKTAFLAEVAAARQPVPATRRRAATTAVLRPFDRQFVVGFDVTRPPSGTPVDVSTATVPEHEAAGSAIDGAARVMVGSAQRAATTRDLSRLAVPQASRGEDWSMLEPHVVNLTRGDLSQSGQFVTTPADLDAIVDAIVDRAAANPSLKLMVHAHGGLVSETSALHYARAMFAWWLSKGVYPVYFVWETGFLETVRQALSGARGVITDATDAGLEELARPAGKPIWKGMQTSARLASSIHDDGTEGGALQFARKLAARAAQLPVHAVGHSAGAIFHAHFLPALARAGVAKVASLSLLAPAVRTELFASTLLPMIQAGSIGTHHHFTMEDEAERDDNVAVVYRKSLLYLVSEAFETDRKEPILGLQRAMKKDAALRALYGLDGKGFPGAGGASAELQYSLAEGQAPNPLTRSRTHGGFDNDPATMSSVLRRILGVPDSTGIGEADFPPDAARAVDVVVAADAVTRAPAIVAGARGARRALCIGIDRYRDRPLTGCVNDARTWSRTLDGLGFEVRELLDEHATARGMQDALRALLESAEPGDVLAMQYSGHGTQLPDDDGDESDAFDEALVPIDYRSGALFLRDDVMAEALARLPAGVGLTLFMDCCHCGTNSRFAPAMRAVESPTDRVRYLPLPPELLSAAQSARRVRGSRALEETSAPGVIHLAACRDDEFAWESNGQGDFTAAATAELAAAFRRGDTNEAFLDRVRQLVLVRNRQHPLLMPPAEGMSDRRLLMPLGESAGLDRVSPTAPAAESDRELLQHLEAAAGVLRRRLG